MVLRKVLDLNNFMECFFSDVLEATLALPELRIG